MVSRYKVSNFEIAAGPILILKTLISERPEANRLRFDDYLYEHGQLE